MKQYGLVLLLAVCLLPATPVSPGWAGQGSWRTAGDADFQFARFDGEYYPGDGKVYFMGGRLASGGTDGSVWSYDTVTGEYADTGVDLVTPISNYRMNLLQDADGRWGFYVFCGRTASGVHTRAVQVYYPDTNSVAQLPPADDYPGTTCSAAMNVVYNNRVYMAGGFDGVTNEATSGYFDPKAAVGAKWVRHGDISPPRAYIMGAVVDGLIYAIGGAWYNGLDLVNVDTVQVMDPQAAAPAWNDAAAADLPEPCSSSQAYGFDSASPYRDPGGTPLAGGIVCGCGSWPDENERVYVYSIGSNTWEAFPSLQLDRRDQAGAFIPPGSVPKGLLSGICMWGGRKDSDANVLATPEYYLVSRFPWPMFLPGVTGHAAP